MINAAARIVAMKLTKLSPEKAGEFYAVHSARPFYGELCEFMSSGPIVAAILEKDNAVDDFRTLIGATNPARASRGYDPEKIRCIHRRKRRTRLR